MGQSSVAAKKGPDRSGPRRTLSRRRILEASLRVVDQEGLDALNMRRLGAELGVDPMSVYNHVAGKDALLDGVVDLLWEDIAAPSRDGEWVEHLRGFTRGLRGVFRTHPNAAPLVLRRSVLPQPALVLFHAHLQILRDAGFETARAAEILRTLVSYGAGYALAELTCLGVPGTEGRSTPLSEREILVCLGQALPPDTPPHLVETAIVMNTGCDADACFDTGLNLILQGLVRHTPIPGRHTKSRRK